MASLSATRCMLKAALEYELGLLQTERPFTWHVLTSDVGYLVTAISVGGRVRESVKLEPGEHVTAHAEHVRRRVEDMTRRPPPRWAGLIQKKL